jgi:hypothetical protein
MKPIKVTTVEQARALREVSHPYLDHRDEVDPKTGITTRYMVSVPFSPSLMRLSIYAQGLLFDPTPAAIVPLSAFNPADIPDPGEKIVTDRTGARLEEPLLANTWERNARGEHTRAVVEAVDPEPFGIDPLTYL